MSDFATRVSGIPCTIKILRYESVPDNLNGHPDSWYEGWEECEYQICDRNGQPAEWLERKATKADHAQIESEIAAHVSCEMEHDY